MTDTQLHELCKGFGALLSRSKVSLCHSIWLGLFQYLSFVFVIILCIKISKHTCHTT